jgi:WD40 repeat protein
MVRAQAVSVIFFAFSLTVCPAPGQDAPPAKPKVDPLGDALPKGALMRLGSIRLFSGGPAGSTCRFSADGSLLASHGLAFSPDGKYLATASGSVILLREPKTGKIVREIPGHLDSVQALAFSADGRKLLSGSDDGSALLWDMQGQ